MGPYSDKGHPATLALRGQTGALWRMCSRLTAERDALVRGVLYAINLTSAARAYLAARDRVDPAGEREARRRLEGLLAEVVE